jgi:hypothetical protein
MGRPRYDPEAIAMNRIVAVLSTLDAAACARVVRHLNERYAVADAIAGTTVRATWQVRGGDRADRQARWSRVQDDRDDGREQDRGQ